MIDTGFKNYEQLTAEEQELAAVLCAGSDERSKPDAEGMNKYGGASFPRQTIAFGSCTNSTISPRGWEAARLAWEAYKQRALEIGALNAADEIGSHIQEKLRELMELEDIDGLKVVLTPSGTDAETIAVFFATLSSPNRFVNIVMGAREVGSGTALAAGAKYFATVTPSGRQSIPGSILDGDLAERIKVHQVKIRVDSAAVRTPEDLDIEIKHLVEASLASQANVILHIVAHSKTGVHAPRLETMNELIATHGKRIVPIIDAAQGRFSRRGLRDYLARGYMVILTGSKFYGGPPFSGCLLIPKNYLPANQSDLCFSPGFSDYLTPAQLPADWIQGRKTLKQSINLGLLLRWQVALTEMRAYYATPNSARYRILRFFESQAPIILGRSPLLELINPPIPIFDDVFERLLESKTTVFSFRIKTGGDSGYQLGRPSLERWVRWMNRDISDTVPEQTPANILKAARTCFQLGQAVHVGEQESGEHDYVIRVAMGGLLIVQIATDKSIGQTLDARIAWLEENLELLRLKIEFIAKNERMILEIEKLKD